MPRLEYNDREYDRQPGESVLDALLRAGAPVSFSCRAGSCGSCLMQASRADAVPAAAQAGLKDTWKARGYFLACVCTPPADFAARSVGADVRAAATITAVETIGEGVLRVRLQPRDAFAYRPGQYLTLFREDGLARSYSIASLADESIELQVRRHVGGRMSEWLAALAGPGSADVAVDIQGPMGECFYLPGREEQPLLLVGTGTGIAPLHAIARDALRAGHRGPVHLYHGAATGAGLYLDGPLRQLDAAHANVHCTQTTLESDGPIDRLVLQHHRSVSGWRVFLCGDPGVVNGLRKKLFVLGASLSDIHADAFQPSAADPRQAAPLEAML